MTTEVITVGDDVRPDVVLALEKVIEAVGTYRHTERTSRVDDTAALLKLYDDLEAAGFWRAPSLTTRLVDSTVELWDDPSGEGNREDGRVVDVVRIEDRWHFVAVQG